MLEYAPYGNLYQRISRKKKLTENEVIAFTRNLFDVLTMLHNKGIIHRDLKLENILMTSKFNNCDFKLADFGSSCYTKKLCKEKSKPLGYTAPELFNRSCYSYKVDVFGAGVIIYILLTGNFPFGVDNDNRVIEKNSICDIKYNSHSFKHLSQRAKDFLQDVLNPEPCQRITSDNATKSSWLNFRKCNDSDGTIVLVGTDCSKSRDIATFSKSIDGLIAN